MSSGIKQPYLAVLKVADLVVELLQPHCQRIEIAGSLRREVPFCGDVEIVLIPRMIQAGLFGEEIYDLKGIESAILVSGHALTKNGPFFKQTCFGNVIVDMFITTPEKWGCIFTIRTGSAGFTRRLVTQNEMGGYCPDHLQFSDGRIWEDGRPLETPEELDVFNTIGMKYVVPQLRD